MISDIYYDKPWGFELSSNIANDIRNEYRCGEGERHADKVLLEDVGKLY
jgi:hypothetical protein